MGKWVDELPKVIWSHNTTESRAIEFTPFNLLYGEEAMTPEELRHGSYRTEAPDEDIKPTIDMIEAIKTQARNQPWQVPGGNSKVVQQEGEASQNQRGRPSTSSHPKEQATR